MPDEIVKVDYEATAVALGRFEAALAQRSELMKVIASGQLVSVRRTFREQGSPADSWAPLSPRTLASGKSKATAGRKILILSGRLLNSIHAESDDGSATVGTNLVYARVQNDGSADLAGAGVGPQARIAGRSVGVGKSSRTFDREIRYGLRTVTGRDGKQHQVPVAQRTGMREITDARGRNTTVRAAFQGPRQRKQVSVAAHDRFQNIPARRFMVLRPEDPARIQGQVISFTARAASRAGLATGGA